MKNLLFFFVVFLNSNLLFSQVSINNNGDPPNGSAMLDVSSTTKGFLPPRMTQTQRTAISSPSEGLLVFQTDATSGYYFFTGTGWILLGGEGGGGHMIDIDGNAYPTVRIGGQEMMAENLRVTHYRNGDAIPNVIGNSTWATMTTGAYCWYNNDPPAFAKYGVLYNWFAVNDSRYLCPFGWHVPLDAEWTTLTTYLGGISIAGGKMKTAILWNSPNTDATNSSAFSGLPGGYRLIDGTFGDVGNYGSWWTSTEVGGYAWDRFLDYSSPAVGVSYYGQEGGFSVRCFRDN